MHVVHLASLTGLSLKVRYSSESPIETRYAKTVSASQISQNLLRKGGFSEAQRRSLFAGDGV